MTLDEIIEEQIAAHYRQLGGHIHCDGERGAFPDVPKRIHDTIVAICRNVVASLHHDEAARWQHRVKALEERIERAVKTLRGRDR